MVNVDSKIFFNSGLETDAGLAIQSVSSSIKVHFYEHAPTSILEEFDISGSQPIIYVLKSDVVGVKLNSSTSTITINAVTYRFTKRVPVNAYIDIYELAE